MTDHGLVLLTLRLILTCGFRTTTKTDATCGPCHGYFIGGSVGSKKPLGKESV
ncbi:MAG TPA: hypothetical protein VF634_04750 [Pyrinomonadaceae bacterium]|jgi:hypothetical protein